MNSTTKTYCELSAEVIARITRSLEVNKFFPASLIVNINPLIQGKYQKSSLLIPSKAERQCTVLIELRRYFIPFHLLIFSINTTGEDEKVLVG